MLSKAEKQDFVNAELSKDGLSAESFLQFLQVIRRMSFK
jgi:hypothetical protein